MTVILGEKVTVDFAGHPPVPTCQRRHWEFTLSTQDKEDRWPGDNSLQRGKLDYCPR